jgi:hypothetical protein
MGNMKMGSGGKGSDRTGSSERNQEQHRSTPVRQQQQQQSSEQRDANKGGGGQSHANQADKTNETGGGLGRGRNR